MTQSTPSSQEISLTYRDNTTNILTRYDTKDEASPVILLLPALGVRVSYYQPFMEHAAAKGYPICTVDWRGQGHSSVRASRKVDYGYEELVQDIKEVTERVSALYPGRKLVVLGHSLGGQLASLCLSRYPGSVDGIILIASALVYHTGWKGNRQWQIWLASRLFPVVARIFGYFPGKQIGFGGREGKTEIIDWARNGRTGQYRLKNSDFDYDAAFDAIHTHLFALPLENDYFAPEPAVENLVRKFGPQTIVSRNRIANRSAAGEKITHFNWAKYPEHVLPYMEDWLKAIV